MQALQQRANATMSMCVCVGLKRMRARKKIKGKTSRMNDALSKNNTSYLPQKGTERSGISSAVELVLQRLSYYCTFQLPPKRYAIFLTIDTG